uniref:Uncharacterized protein n=1 Tax=Lactuca sativa TaxID=4236 RepID=A0A9R1WQM0_LACSA|nr:hypothetical protein LSAT_V11C100028950 [Lactuca sativa]
MPTTRSIHLPGLLLMWKISPTRLGFLSSSGLLQFVKDILPHMEHRKAYIGLEFKKLFGAVVMSCVEGDFKRHMDAIKKLNPSQGSKWREAWRGGKAKPQV